MQFLEVFYLSDVSLTLKFGSKFKYENISELLRYDFLYPSILFSSSKANSKEVIEVSAIFRDFWA
jgi:hypothetical protein